jgi:cardiolipin synthase
MMRVKIVAMAGIVGRGPPADGGRRPPRIQPVGSQHWRRQVLSWPNLVTVVRLLCIPVFLWLLFAVENRAAAAWLLAALGATDWVDGWLARRFDMVTELGKILDPTVDRVLFLVTVPALVIDGSVPLVVAALVLVREAVVGLAALALGAMGARRIDVTREGKTGTLLLMFAFPLFLGAESTLGYAPVLGWLAWVFALPGLAYSYSAAAQYVPRARAALAEGRAARTR